MSSTIKFTVSDENYTDLCARASRESLSIQDYIRMQLFPGQIAFTPLDAVNRALAKYEKGDTFSVPELYGDEWDLPNGMAGQFGKKFYKLVTSTYGSQIRFTGTFNAKKHAIYEFI